MRLALAFAAVALAFGSAAAQTPPTFDIVGWCQDNVASGAFAEDGVQGCVAVEQRKFRSLWALYRASPAPTRAYCETFARDATGGRGSYAVLGFCLHDQMQGAR